MTLIEISFAMTILTAASIMAASLVVSLVASSAVNRETSVATAVCREVVEDIQSLPFEELFSTLNADPLDDPNGPGTARGNRYSVTRQSPETDLERNRHEFFVTIQFPVDDAGKLSENVAPLVPGLPEDLNVDGEVDAEDHANSYRVLPFTVTIEWQGLAGARRMVIPRVMTKGVIDR